MRAISTLEQLHREPAGVPFIIPAALLDGVTVDASVDFFPPMSADEATALTADIRTRGQSMPVSFYHGALIDGRHRLNAARALGRDLAAVNVPLPAGQTPTDYALSMNTQRRDVSTSQRAMLAARLWLRDRANGMMQSTAAARLRVADRYLRDALWLEQNDPARAAAVWRGEVALKTAVRARQAETAAAVPAVPAVAVVGIDVAETEPVPPVLGTLESIIAGLIVPGTLQPVAWLNSLPPAQRASLVVALDEFARRAYDAADEAGILPA